MGGFSEKHAKQFKIISSNKPSILQNKYEAMGPQKSVKMAAAPRSNFSFSSFKNLVSRPLHYIGTKAFKTDDPADPDPVNYNIMKNVKF